MSSDELTLKQVLEYAVWGLAISVEEVVKQAGHRSKKIFQYWHQLHNRLNHHEDVLQRRWSKKSQSQRREVLLKAWPDMALHHRPDFDALRREPLELRGHE
jgi:hypothetical protein